jgi:hypothetical protein
VRSVWAMRPGALLIRSSILAVTLGALLAVPASAQTANAGLGTVVVVHALEGVTADVYLDGAQSPALQSFDFRRITDPLAVPAGDHRADIRKAGDPPTAPPAMSGTFTVTPNERITVAALLSPTGAPSWLAFPNDTWTTGDATKAAFRFRHVAATGPVKIAVDGSALPDTFTNLAVGNQAQPFVTAPGSHTLAVTDAATGSQLVAAQAFDIGPGSIINIYLTGKASPRSLALLAQADTAGSAAQQVAPLAQTPQVIATGDSGLADPGALPSTGSRWTALLVGLALTLACGAVFVVGARRLVRVRLR